MVWKLRRNDIWPSLMNLFTNKFCQGSLGILCPLALLAENHGGVKGSVRACPMSSFSIVFHSFLLFPSTGCGVTFSVSWCCTFFFVLLVSMLFLFRKPPLGLKPLSDISDLLFHVHLLLILLRLIFFLQFGVRCLFLCGFIFFSLLHFLRLQLALQFVDVVLQLLAAQCIIFMFWQQDGTLTVPQIENINAEPALSQCNKMNDSIRSSYSHSSAKSALSQCKKIH